MGRKGNNQIVATTDGRELLPSSSPGSVSSGHDYRPPAAQQRNYPGSNGAPEDIRSHDGDLNDSSVHDRPKLSYIPSVYATLADTHDYSSTFKPASTKLCHFPRPTTNILFSTLLD